MEIGIVIIYCNTKIVNENAKRKSKWVKKIDAKSIKKTIQRDVNDAKHRKPWKHTQIYLAVGAFLRQR